MDILEEEEDLAFLNSLIASDGFLNKISCIFPSFSLSAFAWWRLKILLYPFLASEKVTVAADTSTSVDSGSFCTNFRLSWATFLSKEALAMSGGVLFF